MRRTHYLMAGLGIPSGILLFTAMAAEAAPAIQVVVTNPAPGSSGTGYEVTSDGTKIILKRGGPAIKVTFKIEISGWGTTKGLTGYDVYLNYRCPSPPCDCLLSQDSTTCTDSSTCADGAECLNGKCTAPSIKTESSYVYNGLKYLAAVASVFHAPTTPASYPLKIADFAWNVRLAAGQTAPTEPTTGASLSRTVGTLTLNFADACPTGSSAASTLEFESALTELILGSAGTRVKPAHLGATVVCE